MLFFSDDAQAELDLVEAELEMVEVQISELLEKQTKLNSRKNKLLKVLEGACSSAQPSGSSKSPKTSFSKQDLQHYEESGMVYVLQYLRAVILVFEFFTFVALSLQISVGQKRFRGGWWASSNSPNFGLCNGQLLISVCQGKICSWSCPLDEEKVCVTNCPPSAQKVLGILLIFFLQRISLFSWAVSCFSLDRPGKIFPNFFRSQIVMYWEHVEQRCPKFFYEGPKIKTWMSHIELYRTIQESLHYC